MINLLVKQPQRGSNMNWSTSKTSFRIFSLSRSVHVLLPCEMWLDQNGRFSYTPLHFAAKKGNCNDMKLFFLLTFGRFLNIPLHLAVKNGKC